MVILSPSSGQNLTAEVALKDHIAARVTSTGYY